MQSGAALSMAVQMVFSAVKWQQMKMLIIEQSTVSMAAHVILSTAVQMVLSADNVNGSAYDIVNDSAESITIRKLSLRMQIMLSSGWESMDDWMRQHAKRSRAAAKRQTV